MSGLRSGSQGLEAREAAQFMRTRSARPPSYHRVDLRQRGNLLTAAQARSEQVKFESVYSCVFSQASRVRTASASD
jgi:hypothetical protein